jgi:NADPH2:quinone reductase
MKEFKAFRLYNTNNKVIGRVENLNINDLSQGEVLIKTAYSSVNYKDALAATGTGNIIRKFPLVAGINVSGNVVSSSDKRFKEGDAVLVTGYEFGVGHDGGYSEYTRVPAEWVVNLPHSMSLFEAMAIGTAGFTVALCVQRLEENNQKPDLGQFVVTGATGGVGNFAIDIMSTLGYDIVAVTGKPDNHESLIALGAKKILDRNTIKSEGLPLEKGQWGGAIDNVGGDLLAWLTRTTRTGGNIASVGLAGGSHLNTTVMPFILRGISVLGINAPECSRSIRIHLWNRLVNDLAPKHVEKIVKNVVELEDLPSVFEKMLAGETIGRTVVSINPDKEL